MGIEKHTGHYYVGKKLSTQSLPAASGRETNSEISPARFLEENNIASGESSRWKERAQKCAKPNFENAHKSAIYNMENGMT